MPSTLVAVEVDVVDPRRRRALQDLERADELRRVEQRDAVECRAPAIAAASTPSSTVSRGLLDGIEPVRRLGGVEVARDVGELAGRLGGLHDVGCRPPLGTMLSSTMWATAHTPIGDERNASIVRCARR